MGNHFARANRNQPPSSNSALASFDTRIDREGRPCSQCLVVRDRHIALLGVTEKNADQDVHERRWRRKDIEAFRVEQAKGSSFLQARVDGGWVDILRCPGGNGEMLRRFAAHLAQWLRTGRWPEADGTVRPSTLNHGTAEDEEETGEKARTERTMSRWFRSAPSWDASSPSGWQTA